MFPGIVFIKNGLPSAYLILADGTGLGKGCFSTWTHVLIEEKDKYLQGNSCEPTVPLDATASGSKQTCQGKERLHCRLKIYHFLGKIRDLILA